MRSCSDTLLSVKELIAILNQLVRFLWGALLAFVDSRFFLKWIPKPHFGRYGGWYSSLRTLVFKGIDLLIISQKKIQDVLSETSCGCIGHDSLLERSQIHQCRHSESLKGETKMCRTLPLGSKILQLKTIVFQNKNRKTTSCLPITNVTPLTEWSNISTIYPIRGFWGLFWLSILLGTMLYHPWLCWLLEHQCFSRKRCCGKLYINWYTYIRNQKHHINYTILEI